MTRTLTMQLSDAQAERLERFARARHTDVAQTGARLLDEALRMAEHPEIEFRDSVVGRQAYMRGSSLAAWEVVMLARERKNDEHATATYLGWPRPRVNAVLRYAAAYPDEIEGALQENDTFDADTLRRLLPNTQIVDIDIADASKQHPTPSAVARCGQWVGSRGYARWPGTFRRMR